jgi:hypothetical protein
MSCFTNFHAISLKKLLMSLPIKIILNYFFPKMLNKIAEIDCIHVMKQIACQF